MTSFEKRLVEDYVRLRSYDLAEDDALQAISNELFYAAFPQSEIARLLDVIRENAEVQISAKKDSKYPIDREV